MDTRGPTAVADLSTNASPTTSTRGAATAVTLTPSSHYTATASIDPMVLRSAALTGNDLSQYRSSQVETPDLSRSDVRYLRTAIAYAELWSEQATPTGTAARVVANILYWFPTIAEAHTAEESLAYAAPDARLGGPSVTAVQPQAVGEEGESATLQFEQESGVELVFRRGHVTVLVLAPTLPEVLSYGRTIDTRLVAAGF